MENKFRNWLIFVGCAFLLVSCDKELAPPSERVDEPVQPSVEEPKVEEKEQERVDLPKEEEMPKVELETPEKEEEEPAEEEQEAMVEKVKRPGKSLEELKQGYPDHGESLEVVRKRYENYWLGLHGKLSRSASSAFPTVLQQASSAVESFEQLNLKATHGQKFKMDEQRKMPVEQAKVMTQIFNRHLQSLSFAYAMEGKSRSANPYYQSKQVEKLALELFDYLHSCGFKKGMNMKVIYGGNKIPKQASFSDYRLRLFGYSFAVMVFRDVLEEAGMLDDCLATIESYIDGHMFPDKSNKFESQKFYVNSDAVRLAVDERVPYALAQKDEKSAIRELEKLMNVLSTSMRVNPGWADTIKPDGTGFHHRAVYADSYTPGFITEGTLGLYLLEGTQFQPDLEVYDAMELLMDATAFYAESLSVGNRGRGLKCSGIANAMHGYLLAAATPNGWFSNAKPRFARLYERYGLNSSGGRGKSTRGIGYANLLDDVARAKPEAPLLGVRPFPYGGFMVQRGEGWTAGVKAYSKYWWDFEGTKTENAHGHQLGHGSLSVSFGYGRDSDAAAGIDLHNGWDWYRIPGVTGVRYPIRELKASRPTQRDLSGEAFVGGVELDRDFGVFALQYRDRQVEQFPHTPLTARKTYFFLDGKIVALGTDINSRGNADKFAVETTLVQSVASSRSDAKVKLDFKPLSEESLEIEGAEDLWLVDPQGVGYYVPQAEHFYLQRGNQVSRSPNDSQGSSSGRFLTAGFKHGVKVKDAAYEYVVVPEGAGLRSSEVSKLAKSYSVLQRDGAHILFDQTSKVLAAAVYDKIKKPIGMLQSVSTPCVLLLKQEKKSEFKLSVANPDLALVKSSQDLTGKDLFASYSKLDIGAKSKVQPVRVNLKGDWKLVDPPAGVKRVNGGRTKTVIEFSCVDGKTLQVLIKKN